MANKVPARNKVNKKFTWNAESVFKSPQAWEKEIKQIVEDIPNVKKYQGRLAEGPAVLLEAIKAAHDLIARTQIVGSTVPTLAASLAVVTVVDGLIGSALLGVLWATGVLPVLPALPGTLAVGLGALGLAVGAAGIVLAFRLRPEPMRQLARRAAQGLRIVRQPGRYACTVLPFQFVAWACRIGVVWLVLAAFGIRTSLATAALVVVLNGASTLVPVPGGAGTQQVLATFALQGAVSTAAAVSFSLGLQVGVTAVNVTVGVAAMMLLFRTARPAGALRSARALVAQRAVPVE